MSKIPQYACDPARLIEIGEDNTATARKEAEIPRAYVRVVSKVDYDVLLAELERVKAETVRIRKFHAVPTHGPCCTCQRCGLDHDRCRCDLDEVVDQLVEAEARVRELEAQLLRHEIGAT